jgi:hypothetical protein
LTGATGLAPTVIKKKRRHLGNVHIDGLVAGMWSVSTAAEATILEISPAARVLMRWCINRSISALDGSPVRSDPIRDRAPLCRYQCPSGSPVGSHDGSQPGPGWSQAVNHVLGERS